MAVTVPMRFQASVIDKLGIRGSITSHVVADDAQTLAQVRTALGAWLSLLQNTTIGGGAHHDLVNGGILRATATVVPTLGPNLITGDPNAAPFTNMPSAPAADSRVDEVGVWDMSAALTPYHWGQVLVALNDAVLAGGLINPADPAVTAFQAALIAAVLGGNYTNQAGQVLTATYATFQGDRKHRRREHELTLNPNP